tara:strand:- start:484 stop:687 length:204 start_codon:yes stop_codon:yes gene_type:complete
VNDPKFDHPLTLADLAEQAQITEPEAQAWLAQYALELWASHGVDLVELCQEDSADQAAQASAYSWPW